MTDERKRCIHCGRLTFGFPSAGLSEKSLERAKVAISDNTVWICATSECIDWVDKLMDGDLKITEH